MKRNGYRLVSGRHGQSPDAVDVGMKNLTGKDCQIALDEAGITTNRNDSRSDTLTVPRPAASASARPPARSRGMKERRNGAIRRHDSPKSYGHTKTSKTAHKVRPACAN